MSISPNSSNRAKCVLKVHLILITWHHSVKIWNSTDWKKRDFVKIVKEFAKSDTAGFAILLGISGFLIRILHDCRGNRTQDVKSETPLGRTLKFFVHKFCNYGDNSMNKFQYIWKYVLYFRLLMKKQKITKTADGFHNSTYLGSCHNY